MATSHPSQIDGGDRDIEEEGLANTEPVLTLADMKDSGIDMSECVYKMLEGLRGDAFSIARKRLLPPAGIDHLKIRQ